MAVGVFVYSASPPSNAITVELSLRDGGEPLGIVHIPVELERWLTDEHRLAADASLAIPYAIGYAIVIGMMLGADVVLTGDEGAWSPVWGPLSHIRPEEPQLGERVLLYAN